MSLPKKIYLFPYSQYRIHLSEQATQIFDVLFAILFLYFLSHLFDLQHFELETDDLAGLKWSPDGEVLCVWESSLSYKVLLYSIDGRLISSYSAYEHALGIKSLCWSPSGQFVAVGSHDQLVMLYTFFTSQFNSIAFFSAATSSTILL